MRDQLVNGMETWGGRGTDSAENLFLRNELRWWGQDMQREGRTALLQCVVGSWAGDRHSDLLCVGQVGEGCGKELAGCGAGTATSEAQDYKTGGGTKWEPLSTHGGVGGVPLSVSLGSPGIPVLIFCLYCVLLNLPGGLGALIFI